MYYITRGLADGLLALASDREPERVTVGLSVTRAADLDTDLDPETPVFTHFYFPAENSVSGVFGVDLGTPRTQGRFVSHPDGRLELTLEDDLHEVVFLAVPPWDAVAAFDRAGRRKELTVLDVEPPVETV